MRKQFKAGYLVIMFNLLTAGVILLTGCQELAPELKSPAEIKVITEDATVFNRNFGDYINYVYPDAHISVISTEQMIYSARDPMKKLKEIIDENKPDLIVGSSPDYYRYLADNGLLEDLTVRMVAAGMSESQYHQGIIELLKANDAGSLFGFAPLFNAQLMFYNKDLFQRYGIEPPKDGMTWKDVLDLSYRFEAAGSRKNGVVGFFNPYTIKTLDDFIDVSMNQTEGLQLIDRLRGKVTIDTPAWRSMYETAINALHNGSIRLSEPETNTADMQDLFADGKAAMYITFNNNMALKQIRSFKVGAVQAPTSVSEPGKYARSIYLPGIFSVYSGSDQKDAMWNIIRYMASEKAAKANSKLDYDISTYYKSPQLITDPLVQKLFDQKYSNLPRQWEEQNRYDSFWTSFNKLREREINKAVIGGQTVAAALGVIQKEGQKQLDQVLATSKQMEGEGS